MVVVSVREGEPTTTAPLFTLCPPVQSACLGVTAYFHVPDGTPNSVQVSTPIVPVHDARTVCEMPFAVSNRWTV